MILFLSLLYPKITRSSMPNVCAAHNMPHHLSTIFSTSAHPTAFINLLIPFLQTEPNTPQPSKNPYPNKPNICIPFTYMVY